MVYMHSKLFTLDLNTNFILFYFIIIIIIFCGLFLTLSYVSWVVT
jgi:hypothetical protein